MNAPTAFPDQKPVPPYKHTPLFPLGADTTPYKKVTTEGVRVERVLGKDMLVVSREALRALSEAAFGDINHYLRPGHLKQLRSILDDKEASDNDKFVAYDFLKNANIAAGGVLPMRSEEHTSELQSLAYLVCRLLLEKKKKKKKTQRHNNTSNTIHKNNTQERDT